MANLDTNITISQQELNNELKEINKLLANQLYEKGKQQNLIMKKAALKFLISAKENEKRIKEIEERAKILHNLRSSLGFKKGKAPNEQILNKYNEEKEKIQIQKLQVGQFQNFFKEMMIFNESILSILEGKQLISIVVENSKKQPVILDITLEDFFKLGGVIKEDISSSGKITGRINLSVLQTHDNLQSALQGDKILDNNSFEKLQQTYILAKTDYQNHSPYAFWKINQQDKWHGIKIAGGLGDIAEAYSMFAHEYGPSTEKFNNLYNNLDVFFREGVAQVDNISGLYTSDITTSNGYSLAVKAANASLPGFVQMIDLANKIIKNEVNTVEDLQKITNKKKGLNEQGLKENLSFGLRNKIYESTSKIPKKYSVKINLFNFD